MLWFTTMSRNLLLFAKFYNMKHRYNVMFTDYRNTLMIKWEDVASKPQSIQDIMNLYETMNREARKHNLRNIGLAVVTGSYQREFDDRVYNGVIDIDSVSFPDTDAKISLAKQLAREGFMVVNTVRGLHLHFKTKDEDVYAITLSDTNTGNKAGEGGVFWNHLWMSPPSKRPIGQRFFTYTIVTPRGEHIATFDDRKLNSIEIAVMSVNEVSNLLESMFGIEVKRFSAKVGPGKLGKEYSGQPVQRLHYIYSNIESFIYSIHNFQLPKPVAIILYNYYKAHGHYVASNNVLLRSLAGREYGPVPHGIRFLASAEFTLFVAHLVSYVRFKDILEILSYGVEDFPHDSNGRLDSKLKYLLLFDETGEHVIPRYGGLGSLRPLHYCDTCLWREECLTKNTTPWAITYRFIRRLTHPTRRPTF